MIASTPASTARLASSTSPTVCRTTPPAAWTSAMYGCGSPQKNEMIRAPSSRQASSRACWSHSSTRFTAHGRSVLARRLPSICRSCRSLRQLTASVPSAPASDTAAVSSTVVALPTGAWISGSSTPSSSRTLALLLGACGIIQCLPPGRCGHWLSRGTESPSSLNEVHPVVLAYRRDGGVLQSIEKQRSTAVVDNHASHADRVSGGECSQVDHFHVTRQ